MPTLAVFQLYRGVLKVGHFMSKTHTLKKGIKKYSMYMHKLKEDFSLLWNLSANEIFIFSPLINNCLITNSHGLLTICQELLA